MPKLKSAGGTLNYEIHGTKGPWLAFVSGLGGRGVFWRAQVDRFALDHRVLIHDHRGYGQSSTDVLSSTIPQLADDVIALFDAVGAEEVNLVGHSMGGMIAQTLALDYPDRLAKLVISGSGAKLGDYEVLLNEFRGRVLEKLGVDDYCRLLTIVSVGAAASELSRDEMKAMEEQVRTGTPQTELVLSRIRSINAFDRLDELTKIRIPTLVVASEDDNQCPLRLSRAIHDAIPNSVLEVFTNGGHFFPRTRPEQYNGLLERFLATEA